MESRAENNVERHIKRGRISMRQFLINRKTKERKRLAERLAGRIITALLMVPLAAVLTACGGKELPENEVCNNGPYAVMETENGYYTNKGLVRYFFDVETVNGAKTVYPQHLCYFDKENKSTVVLCDKAECEHNGDENCVGSYKGVDVIHTTLYDGMIYIYCLEEKDTLLEFNLYKAALDGSSIDKVGTAFSVENTDKKDFIRKAVSRYDVQDTFIIHKGMAYLPYYLRIGKTSSGFKGGGLVQMDLKTGAVKSVYEMEQFRSNYPVNLFGAGDYVYMMLTSDGAYSGGGGKRYCISKEELQEFYQYEVYADEIEEGQYVRAATRADVVTDKYILNLRDRYFYDPETQTTTGGSVVVEAYDVVGGIYREEAEFTVDISLEEYNEFCSFLKVSDVLVIATVDRVLFYGLDEENWGHKLSEMPYEYEGGKLSHDYVSSVFFSSTNGKLYKTITETLYYGVGGYVERLDAYFFAAKVECCSMEDILAGKGQWQYAYSYEPGIDCEIWYPEN